MSRSDTKSPRREQRPRDERRRELALAALACLRRDGYVALTARKVAAEAGISLGNITYHFKDMQDLLEETYRLASDQLIDATMADLERAPRSPEESLRAFLWAGFGPEILEPDYLRVRIDLWSAARIHPALARTERALYDSYRARLQTLVGALGGTDEAVAQASNAIMAMLDGLWLDWMRRRDRGSIDSGLDVCLSLARATARPRP